MPGVELWVLHLVRDPRGMAWSWQKQLRQPGPTGRALPRHRPEASALRWDAYNLFAERLLRPRLGPRYHLVRYEDLVDDPARALGSVLSWLGDPCDALPLVGDPPALALHRPQHQVWGNPVRTSTGTLPITLDDEWRRAMPAGDRLVATAVALPFLHHYGYELWPTPVTR